MMEHGWYLGLIPLNKKEYKELLEKAELWDDYKQILQDLTTKNQEQYEQLEAVKKFVEKGPSINVDTLEDCQQMIDDWLGKLMNILEADE